MPAPVQGERVCAYIELKEGVESFTKKEAWALMEAEKVARYKWPDRVELIQGLPARPRARSSKNVLRKQIAEKLKAERAQRGAQGRGGGGGLGVGCAVTAVTMEGHTSS